MVRKNETLGLIWASWLILAPLANSFSVSSSEGKDAAAAPTDAKDTDSWFMFNVGAAEFLTIPGCNSSRAQTASDIRQAASWKIIEIRDGSQEVFRNDTLAVQSHSDQVYLISALDGALCLEAQANGQVEATVCDRVNRSQHWTRLPQGGFDVYYSSVWNGYLGITKDGVELTASGGPNNTFLQWKRISVTYFTEGVRSFGHYDRTPDVSQEWCRNQCLGEFQCAAVSYSTSDRMCFRFNGDENFVTNLTESNAWSAWFRSYADSSSTLAYYLYNAAVRQFLTATNCGRVTMVSDIKLAQPFVFEREPNLRGAVKFASLEGSFCLGTNNKSALAMSGCFYLPDSNSKRWTETPEGSNFFSYTSSTGVHLSANGIETTSCGGHMNVSTHALEKWTRIPSHYATYDETAEEVTRYLYNLGRRQLVMDGMVCPTCVVHFTEKMSEAKPWRRWTLPGDPRIYIIKGDHANECLDSNAGGSVYIAPCVPQWPFQQWFLTTPESEIEVYVNVGTNQLLNFNAATDLIETSKCPSADPTFQQWRFLRSEEICNGDLGLQRANDCSSDMSVAMGAISAMVVLGAMLSSMIAWKSRRRRQAAYRQMVETVLDPASEVPEDPGVIALLWRQILKDAEVIVGMIPDNRRERVTRVIKRYELDGNDLQMGPFLSSGYFSHVCAGVMKSSGLQVAVKMPKNAMHLDNYLSIVSEVLILKRAEGHSNILRLHGIVTNQIAEGKLYLVTELCGYGALGDFLSECARRLQSESASISSDNYVSRSSKIKFCELQPDNSIITATHLVWFAYQIADGLSHLHTKVIIHRDIAARNILVTDSLILKIADFGLSKALTSYSANESKSAPWPWLAIECLRSNEISPQSDIWSFGVVVWEIFSMGRKPHADVPRGNEGEPSSLMAKPSLCPPEIYEIVQNCWRIDPKERPTSAELVSALSDIGLKLFGEAFADLVRLEALESASLSSAEESMESSNVGDEAVTAVGSTSGYAAVIIR